MSPRCKAGELWFGVIMLATRIAGLGGASVPFLAVLGVVQVADCVAMYYLFTQKQHAAAAAAGFSSATATPPAASGASSASFAGGFARRRSGVRLPWFDACAPS